MSDSFKGTSGPKGIAVYKGYKRDEYLEEEITRFRCFDAAEGYCLPKRCWLYF
jgi:hypothetical protein